MSLESIIAGIINHVDAIYMEKLILYIYNKHILLSCHGALKLDISTLFTTFFL